MGGRCEVPFARGYVPPMSGSSLWRLTAGTAALSVALLVMGSSSALRASSLSLSPPTELDIEEAAAVAQVHALYADRRRALAKQQSPPLMDAAREPSAQNPSAAAPTQALAALDAPHVQTVGLKARPPVAEVLPAVSSTAAAATEVVPRELDFTVERSLDTVLQDVPVGGLVWLSFANSAVSQIAVNWAKHVANVGMIRSATIAALDRTLLELLLRERVPCFRHFEEGMESDVRSSRTGFRKLGVIKAELVLRVLAEWRHVLVSDVDVLWLRDPSELLRNRRLADVMVSTDCLSVKADEVGSTELQQGPSSAPVLP